MENRDGIIIRTSVIGIIANIFLAGFKAFVGLISGSIAIVLDAVNNLSDALSSVITIIGTKLAGKKPDKEHPLGHGRYEYLSAAVISLIILYAGLTSIVESFKKIISPSNASYDKISLVIVAVAVVVKIVLGTFVKKTGEKVNSDSLINSGKDALFDSIISLSTLLAAAIYIWSGVGLEAYLGVVISLVIIKSGYDMIKETISDILGKRIDRQLSIDVKKIVNKVEGVMGAYDLILHNYGPDKYLGSIHIEVADQMTAHRIDEITREIQNKVYEENGVIITTVGIYSVNMSDPRAADIRKHIDRIVMGHEYLMQIHGLFVDFEDMRITFDIIIDFDAPDREALCQHVKEDVEEAYPDFDIHVALDSDVAFS